MLNQASLNLQYGTSEGTVKTQWVNATCTAGRCTGAREKTAEARDWSAVVRRCAVPLPRGGVGGVAHPASCHSTEH